MKDVNIVKEAYEEVPWYSEDYSGPARRNPKVKDYLALRPQDIKRELEQYVVGQEEACRQVAIIMYQHLHGHRSVNLLAGSTGSGKSFMAESLQKIFPDVVFLRDISNVTNDGWSGGKKVASIFQGVRNPFSYNGKIYPMIVLDECDKLFAPKTNSGGENVSESVQAEFLSVIHGSEIERKMEKDISIVIDTRPMSFLFAGAFEKQARTIAEKESEASIGFGASHMKLQSYNRALTIDDVHQAGCISELCGRIQKVISLNKLDESQYIKMLGERESGPLFELENEFNIRLFLSEAKKAEMAHNAYESGLGVRGIKNQLRYYIDEAIWEDCDTRFVEVV